VAVSVQSGSFAKVSSADANSQTISGLGFTPKGIIFYSVDHDVNAAVAADAVMCMGMSDGTNHYSVASWSDDNVATSDAHRRHASKAITLFANGAMHAEASVSFASGEFTVTWDTNDTTVPRVFYFVFGGDDIENVHVGTFTAFQGTGTKDYTGLGFDMEDDYGAMFFLARHGTATPPATATDEAQVNFGMATLNNGQEAIAYGADDNEAAADTIARRSDGNAVYGLTYKSGAWGTTAIADLVAYITDGFRLDWLVSADVASVIGYMAVRGGKWGVKLFNTPTSTGTQDLTGFGFDPKAVVQFNIRPTSEGTPPDAFVSSAEFNIGADADGAGSGAGNCWMGDEDAADPTDANRRYRTGDYVMHMLDAATQTIQVAARPSAYITDGVTWDFVTVEATARKFAVGALGDGAIPVSAGFAFASIMD